MAKNKNKPTKEVAEMEKSDVKLEAVPVKKNKKDKAQAQIDKKKAKQNKKNNGNDKPKKSKLKEVSSELKKVNWPSFKNACKQTGAVLVVVSIFALAVLGIDELVAWIISLIAKI